MWSWQKVAAIDLNRPPKKNLEKCLAMPAGIVTRGVILRALEGHMRKLNKSWPVRSRIFRSLLVVAGVLLLTAALAPKANAQNVLVYFNFEDATIGGPYDPAADVQGPPDNNPGGGLVPSTIIDNFAAGHTAAVAGTLMNRTTGDIDTNNPGLALGMNTTVADNFKFLQFGFNATAFSNMSLSFAVNSAGNGFNSVELSYSLNGGGSFTVVGSLAIPSGGGFNILTFANLPSAIDGQPSVILRLTFSGGTSSGNNLQTIIDNIQLTGVPEPTTVAGGLLGVLGLCWHQRRRLIRSVRFRRT